MSKISAAHSPIITPFVLPDALRWAIYIALPKNEVEPIACPLGKLNPEISIKRSNVGRSRSKIFFSKGFNIPDSDIVITKNKASIL